MRVWLPLWSTASCTTARCFTSRDLRFDSKVGHWTASWSPRHLRPPTAPTLDSRLSTALMDRRTQCVEHLDHRCFSEHDPARLAVRYRHRRAGARRTLGYDAVQRYAQVSAELVPDEHLAMTPSSDMPMREGSRDGVIAKCSSGTSSAVSIT